MRETIRLPDRWPEPENIDGRKNDDGPQWVGREVPKRQRRHCRDEKHPIRFGDCDVRSLHVSRYGNKYGDDSRNPDGPGAHPTVAFELRKKNNDGRCAPNDPGKNMGPDCAENDCADIGNECCKSERNSDGTQNLFVRQGYHVRIRLTAAHQPRRFLAAAGRVGYAYISRPRGLGIGRFSSRAVSAAAGRGPGKDSHQALWPPHGRILHRLDRTVHLFPRQTPPRDMGAAGVEAFCPRWRWRHHPESGARGTAVPVPGEARARSVHARDPAGNLTRVKAVSMLRGREFTACLDGCAIIGRESHAGWC